ncbi:Phosphoribosylformylglycinamidine synthase 2 protein [Marine Group I thaumarchaeote SCGC AAA799-E16]|uniref:Phosphoribosylformylglycinamidine synthase subunit PurL n=4 Tax=Marine Group I TaxID=905826 RepID=A0A087S8D7_9ARCH|nr:Phosphoribosylformylglycinamidine synthase 2 protein [Marine Group I thaumarchaeote SCGC AAA799-N04]KER05513.1 Phosphoribosylformylglycinamidine synthase 2 protein [Marine Group I thaumarchaeote SCGC AAA799-E16]KFM18091.1 Phosphoribosylformylglycinamidine synthase 2 protein [Marine Group I thaumarchaeote SCGC RSA3]KFM21991.1 Phosphoribosylformylglycinamidine synthase 2 protein [Marine Group I thaumarchaeote SCGC AAA799-B03]
MSLEPQELSELKSKIGREPTSTELQIVAAEWSEHCSYKSSKRHLKMLPMKGPLVITEKGYDSGVLDVGGGYVVTAHIESHNHPSAVEPYGGAATGVGGVIRDILSAGTRPIAIFDGLRFGNIEKDQQARWLFKNAVTGIADYGNCLGIPTIGGEVEFDQCYENYALVDVAAVGFGKKENLIKNHAKKGDIVVLMGGSTGRDGIGGSQFASDSLESEDRSAVQIPDPFIEKLIIEAILEARNEKLIHAMKDLGGGGLSCAISETADALEIGIEMDVSKVHTRESDMHPDEIMVSESQERMLIVTSKTKFKKLQEICKKFRIGCSVIGSVKSDHKMHVKKGKKTFAHLPTDVVANATLLDLPSKEPQYLKTIEKEKKLKPISDYSKTMMKLLASPNIASKIWVYGQYDHEVGIRTVVKPGRDASVLRLDNGKFLSVKIDGNPKQCYINPREGAIGCFEEACRNVVCTGAKPIGMLDHLQFGNPKDPEIFWTFLESLKGLTDFAKDFKIPCVGGKVSLYNETPDGPIKPTPLIGVIGLIDKHPQIPQRITKDDCLIIVGETKDELGGSEYFEYIHKFIGGKCPAVDFAESKKNMKSVLEIIPKKLLKSVHDCSKGGLAVAVSELAMNNQIGCKVDLNKVPAKKLDSDRILFSESHSRYLLTFDKKNLAKVEKILKKNKTSYNIIGKFGGEKIQFVKGTKPIIDLRVDKAQKTWLNSLRDLVLHG